MAQRNLRLPDVTYDRIVEAAKQQRYPTASAFIRAAIEEKLAERNDDLAALERSFAASLERLARKLNRLETALQAQFALTDAMARVVLLCVPEPPADLYTQALARAKERHERLIKMTALNMQGDSRAALTELVNRGE
jgi:Arc/MetJ-type ribon-helix-helix transcriptional regulator